MRMMAADVARAVDGELVGQNAHLDGATFDSRTLRPGQLFVPIVAVGDDGGSSGRDGHDFVADALARGAGAYLTAREPVGRTAIRVPDTLAALLALGRWARTRLEAPLRGRVVGITGSVGKTGTKDLVAAALGAGLRVHASRRSFNNDQGLPTTILEAPDDAEALVLEMGMRGLGEIARLCAVGAPRVGIVTRIGSAHSARVGGIEGVARAKGELVEALPADGHAILNADDPRVAALRGRTRATTLTWGEAADADVRMTRCEPGEGGAWRAEWATPWGAAAATMPLPGRHVAHNAGAAIAAAGLLGVDVAAAAAALATAPMSPMRMQRRRTAAGAVVLDDTYNANPESMQAALETLASLPARRRVAVLGEMAEVDDPDGAHRGVADLARSLGIELVAVATPRYGTTPVGVADAAALVAALGDGEAAVVKASRAAGLDAVTRGLAGA
jgi:UDP-N-acetylmuramoyl-tripeptide--D-alanyl-D-alanine ligase